MSGKYIITVHSFYGSSYEASCPMLVLGPYEKTLAEKVHKRVQKVLKPHKSDIFANLTPIDSDSSELTEQEIKDFLNDYYGEEFV